MEAVLQNNLMARFIAAQVGLALCLIALDGSSAFAQCVPPNHHMGRFVENTVSSVYLTVSLPFSDFSPQKLVCLAAALRQQYRDRKNDTVLVFDSPEAAEHYQGDIEVGDTYQGAYYRNLHAVYVYDAVKREEYVRIKPFGFLLSLPEDTRIDLPVTGIPRCRLEINQRCLISMARNTYSAEGYSAQASAAVTLTATVTREGTLTDVDVVNAGGNSGSRASFVREAVDNLKTWRLEPALRQDRFRITYSYKIDQSIQRGMVDVQYALPNQVTIRANP